MTPGTSQGMSMVRTERSEAYRKKRFLFLSSDGNTLIKVTMTITLKRKQEVRAFSHATLFQDNVHLFNFYLGQIMFLGTAATAKLCLLWVSLSASFQVELPSGFSK